MSVADDVVSPKINLNASKLPAALRAGRDSNRLKSQMKTLRSEENLKDTETIEFNINKCRGFKIPHLSDFIPNIQTRQNNFFRTKLGGVFEQMETDQIKVSDNHWVLADIVRRKQETECSGFLRAGSR